MIKENLPVIILKGIILLPNNEIRLEFDNNSSSNVIDISEMFHDNEILIVNQNNPLEETPDKNDLPRIGVIGKITHKVELPNGKTRIIIKGIKRANIHEYLNHSADVIESIISETSFKKIDEDKYSVVCSVSLADFFDEFNMKEEIDDFEVQTVNGWVIKEFGYLPKVGESFVYKNMSISISKIEERRIKEIIVEINTNQQDN